MSSSASGKNLATGGYTEHILEAWGKVNGNDLSWS